MKFTKGRLAVTAAIAVAAVLGGQALLTHSARPLPESSVIQKVTTEPELKALVDSAGTKLLVLDLYADWCGPCRMLHPTLEALATKYAGSVGFYRINVDASPAIASSFGTSGIPYVVFVKDGKAITSLVGLNPRESYEKVITACAATTGTCDKVLSSL